MPSQGCTADHPLIQAGVQQQSSYVVQCLSINNKQSLKNELPSCRSSNYYSYVDIILFPEISDEKKDFPFFFAYAFSERPERFVFFRTGKYFIYDMISKGFITSGTFQASCIAYVATTAAFDVAGHRFRTQHSQLFRICMKVRSTLLRNKQGDV